jgi:SulP family sulfate permease
MIATVIAVVATHNLAIGVLTGVLLSGVFFASKVAQIFRVSSTLSDDQKQRVYVVEGQIFFASADSLIRSFDFKEAIERVKIDVGRSHIWDLTGVGAVDSVVLKFRREGTEVELIGLNEASSTIVDRLAIHDKPDAFQSVTGH